MKRRVLFAAASSGVALAIVACACARAPETPPSPTPEPASGARDAGDAGDGQTNAPADARVPGLPMPQKFPQLVWDAAGATH